jgi:hypothetical protein
VTAFPIASTSLHNRQPPEVTVVAPIRRSTSGGPERSRRPRPGRRPLSPGGGFAGLEAAILLRRAGLDVTLASDRPGLFVYPTSIWVACYEASKLRQVPRLPGL